jgi:hypothetical protein
MEATVLTATATAMGSLVGASASIATTWITQRKQSLRANSDRKLCERESLYKEFITEASRLAVDALVNSLDRPDQIVPLYGVLSCIRLVAGDEVLAEAEECCRRIVERYWRPNLTPDQVYASIKANEFDLLKGFSMACRKELLTMSLAS